MHSKDKRIKFRQRVYKAYRQTTVRNPFRPMDYPLKSKVRQYRQRWGRFLREVPKDAYILDIGYGSGEFLYFLQSLGFVNIKGIDISEEQIEAARSLINPQNVRVATALTYLKKHRNHYNIINCQNVLKHLDRDEMFILLDQVSGALVPGGCLFVVIPNAKSPFGARVRYADITHEQAFTPESILQICATVGFEPIVILEHGPLVHGIVSFLRWSLWQLIRLFIFIALMAETADLRYRIYTQDIMAVLRKPITRDPKEGGKQG